MKNKIIKENILINFISTTVTVIMMSVHLFMATDMPTSYNEVLIIVYLMIAYSIFEWNRESAYKYKMQQNTILSIILGLNTLIFIALFIKIIAKIL